MASNAATHRVAQDDGPGFALIECSTRPGETFAVRYEPGSFLGQLEPCPFCGRGVRFEWRTVIVG